MIATRRRRFRIPVMRYVKLLVFGVVVYELCSVPLTHNFLFNGPLKPFWMQVATAQKKFISPVIDPVVTPLIKPLHFAVQQKALSDSQKQIVALKKSLADEQTTENDNMKTIADLQKKLQASAKPAGAAGAAGTAGGAGAGVAGAAPLNAASPSPDDLKNAAYWASMEPENAAQIAQALPPLETARVFAAMKPDQVAEIMNVLPTAYNVKLKAVRLGGSAGI